MTDKISPAIDGTGEEISIERLEEMMKSYNLRAANTVGGYEDSWTSDIDLLTMAEICRELLDRRLQA